MFHAEAAKVWKALEVHKRALGGTRTRDLFEDFVRVDLRGVAGPETVYARKVVLAGWRAGWCRRALHAAVPIAGCRTRSRQQAHVSFLG